jgi:hypothetical protein
MRKIFISICLSLSLAFSLCAEEPLRERVYLSTDRDVFVAGDAVWLSAYCLDMQTRQLSSFSKIAYVELHGAGGLACTAKIALDGGRGAASMQLPNTLPTGNYRLFAYTQLGAGETGFDPLPGARVLSVFNTFTTERSEGVTVADRTPEAAARRRGGPLELQTSNGSGATRVTLRNTGGRTVFFDLSVHHRDLIPAPAGQGVFDFAEAELPGFQGYGPDTVAEYEGEILRARVTGTDAAGVKAMQDKYAFISSPGSGENVYSSAIQPDGTVRFFTTNVYGEQEMFLEIEGVERTNICHLELESPFRNFPAGEIPALQMSNAYAPALELRSLGMQVERNFNADSLYTDLPFRYQQLFGEDDRRSYILDDYTRFPVMEELFVEFIPELRVRRVGDRREIQVRATDGLGNMSFPQGAALVMVDGIPVLDHGKILSYDSLLVERIDIWSDTYFMGIRAFSGIVNFVTYKGNLPSMQFEDNVRIVDFQGCGFPQAYTGKGAGARYPDFRQTLYWHPLLSLAPGETLTVDCKMPEYEGAFEAVAEGFTDAGDPVSVVSILP